MENYIRTTVALRLSNSTKVHCYDCCSIMWGIWLNIHMNWILLWLRFYRNCHFCRIHICMRFCWIQKFQSPAAQIHYGLVCKRWLIIYYWKFHVLKASRSGLPTQQNDCSSIHRFWGLFCVHCKWKWKTARTTDNKLECLFVFSLQRILWGARSFIRKPGCVGGIL